MEREHEELLREIEEDRRRSARRMARWLPATAFVFGVVVLVIQHAGNHLIDAPPGYLPSGFHNSGTILLCAAVIVGIPVLLLGDAQATHPRLGPALRRALSWAAIAIAAWQFVPSTAMWLFGALHEEDARLVEVTKILKDRVLVIELHDGKRQSIGLGRGEWYKQFVPGAPLRLSGRRGFLGFHVARAVPR